MNSMEKQKIADAIIQKIEQEQQAEAKKATEQKLNSQFGGIVNKAFRVSMAAKFWHNFK